MRARHHRSRRSNARRQFVKFIRPLLMESLEERALLTITPQLLADINPTITQLVHVESAIVETGGIAFFAGNDGTYGAELWKSDGTAAGTVLVKDIRSSASSNPQNLVNVNGTIFFSANRGDTGYELWKSDGTDVGTIVFV